MRLFYLDRSSDVTGISGTGIVARGCEFSDGTCILSWQSPTPSIAIRSSLKAVEEVHGHKGATCIHYSKLHAPNEPNESQAFWLGHTENRHGLSAVGPVAECCKFPNDWVAMRWLVPPYGVEVFTSLKHWANVHSSQIHTYVIDLPEASERTPRGLLNLESYRWYRKWKKGVWFHVQSPLIPYKYEAWSRATFSGERLLAVEIFL